MNLLTGLLLGADLLITQIFFDSIFNVSTGNGAIKGVFIAFTIYVTVKLATNISEGIRQFTVETHSSKIMGYMVSKINKKSAFINLIDYENPNYLDDINKATEGADAAIYFNTVTSFIVTYHLPYFLFMIFYLNNLKPILTLCLLFVFIPVLISHFLRSSVLSKLEDKAASVRREYDAYYDAACGKEFYKETRMLGAFRFLKGQLSNSINTINSATMRAKKTLQ